MAEKDAQDETPKQTPHNALRTVEATLRRFSSIYVPPGDPTWQALDFLWEYVVKGGQ